MTKENVGSLFEEYKSQIYRLCVQLAKNQADAEDLFQDTFLLALQKNGRIDEHQNPRSYLYTMCLNLWKTGKRKRTAVYSSEGADSLVFSETPEDAMLFKEQKQIIIQAVKALKDKYRIPVILYYSADMPVSEIAQVLKIPEGTVKSRLYKARALLKERLGEQDGKQ
ncbi:MAG: RNA polymerase sigma factor [Oscillospiraceae bacterium]|nr:RNA polymerase sigma factor [Oscillospiraceae bacterium]